MTKKMRSRVKSKKNPFKKHQENAVACREEIIEQCLLSLKELRASFSFVTDLAKAVAAQVTQIESEPCSYTTLLRNERYRALLEEFGASNVTSNSTQVSEPRVEARTRMLELDVGNVQRDNERLRAYISDLEERVATRSLGTAPTQSNYEEETGVVRLSNEKALACKAIWLILDHFRDVVSVDIDRRCIIDLAAPARKNIIVDSAVAKIFIDWLSENAWVGH